MRWICTLILLLDHHVPRATSSSSSFFQPTVIIEESESTEPITATIIMTTDSASVDMDGTSHNSGIDSNTGTTKYSSCITSMINSSSVDPPELECGLWLALSSLPGSGLGMYAGRDFMEYEHLQDTGDIVVPIVDKRAHAANLTGKVFLWDEYTWDGVSVTSLMQLRREGFVSTDFASPGFGSAANSFLALQNVDESHPTWNHSGLHRSRDPGVGAFSQYGNRFTFALRNIRAGEELYVSYSDNWFIGRPHLGAIPLTHDLDRATSLAYALGNLSEVESLQPHAVVLLELWDVFVRGDFIYSESRVLAAFNHDDPQELNHLLHGMNLAELRISQSTKDLSWLRQHGVCADHIRAGPSTLKQAGNGAFARRSLPKNTIVTSMPLIHIPDRAFLNMYALVLTNESSYVPQPEHGVTGIQLLINYCFGHAATTLLLCPYGPHASYINHNQSLVNVKLEWGNSQRGTHQSEYLNASVEELENSSKSAKLTMHVIATRDILKDEEIFLDYGDLWEAAWQDHVRHWKPVVGSETYQHAVELNRDETTPLLSPKELELRNLHNTVDIIASKAIIDDATWKNHYPDSIEKYFNDHEDDPFTWDAVYKCDILSSRTDEHGNLLYTASVYEWDHENDPFAVHPLQEHSTLIDAPRQAFTYFERPYSSDTFLVNAFRHPMQLPDHLFPALWRNMETMTTTTT